MSRTQRFAKKWHGSTVSNTRMVGYMSAASFHPPKSWRFRSALKDKFAGANRHARHAKVGMPQFYFLKMKEDDDGDG